MVKELWNKRKGFTLIELIVVMAIIGILVLLAAPRFLGRTNDAHEAKHLSDTRVLEDASERYFIDHGDWPRLNDDPYTSDELDSFAERIRDVTGEETELTEGDYYDIDYDALSQYAKLPGDADRGNYILRNPVGKVYYLENLTEAGRERTPVVDSGLEYGETYDFAYTGSAQEIELPAGTYQLEVWGAQGGSPNARAYGGKGGFSTGELTLDSQQTIYVYIGGTTSTFSGGWNGGGTTFTAEHSGAGGGGGTDVRFGDNLESRLIVAGGGGGASYNATHSANPVVYAGYGGGVSGGDGTHTFLSNWTFGTSGKGGRQDQGGSPGIRSGASLSATAGSFGFGGNGARGGSASGGGGGGGHYGGGGGTFGNNRSTPGGGGSSYIGGVQNGQTIAGNQTMPNPSGGTMTGNTGHGFARITVIK